MSTVTIAEMAQHIADLCDYHEIETEWRARADALAWSGGAICPVISIAPVRSVVTYCVALHEIGHICGPDQNKGIFKRERGAWRWARQTAKLWTPRMQATADRCLDWYRIKGKAMAGKERNQLNKLSGAANSSRAHAPSAAERPHRSLRS